MPVVLLSVAGIRCLLAMKPTLKPTSVVGVGLIDRLVRVLNR